ncbi:MAG TPA: RNA polymerase sigma factor [Planctomycetota bacterium]
MGAAEEPVDLSRELVRRIQAGDRAAFEGLYLRYHDALLFSVRSRLGRRLRACLSSEDVLQSVFEDALGELARFEPRGPGALGHYLHACVLNKIRARAERLAEGPRAREERCSSSVLEQLPARAGEPRYLDGARYERLERGLEQLADEAREVVLLRSVEGLSNEEAARLLGTTPAAASKLYNRALARLASWMQAGA